MNFWQENKLFATVAGVVALVCLLLWPSCIGEWLAPWSGPVVVSLQRKDYGKTELERRRIKDQLDSYYPRKGDVVATAIATEKAMEANKVLLANYEEMSRWMSFVPRFPFRIPARRRDENERQRYVSLAYTYARTGEFPCTEFEIRDPSDGVVWLASTRNIKLGDPYFGLSKMEMPEAIEDPETRIIQVALIHELGHLAIRVGVDEIVSIAPGSPYDWGIDGLPVAHAYPVTVKVKCDLPTLVRFIHALDGTHGRVSEVQDPAVAARAAAPAPADREAVAPDDDPDDPEAGGKPPAPPPAHDDKPIRLRVELFGEPSTFRPDRSQGNLKERLTVFRADRDDPSKLQFVANAIVRGRRNGTLTADLEPTSDLRFPPDVPKDQRPRNDVREGDLVATRFFLVRSMKVAAAEAEIEKDQDGFPVSVTPAHLDAEVSVAALRFIKPTLPEAAAKAKPAAKRPEEPKKKPGLRF